MAAVDLVPADLAPFASIDEARAQAMIDDTLARAARVAPCILEPDFDYPEAAKAVLRAIVLRWNDSGTGALQTQAAGPFSMGLDTRQQNGPRFLPSEIAELQDLCSTVTGNVYTVSLAGPDPEPLADLGWA